MIATRYSKSTDDNLEAILALIRADNCTAVYLFATEATCTNSYTDVDGPDTNLPLVAALATYRIPRIDNVHVVFDGLFLTAARKPRYLEVKQLMDEAEGTNKVMFSSAPIAFTSALTPEGAAKVMLNQQQINPFNPQTRAQFFSMLSSLTESEYAKL